MLTKYPLHFPGQSSPRRNPHAYEVCEWPSLAVAKFECARWTACRGIAALEINSTTKFYATTSYEAASPLNVTCIIQVHGKDTGNGSWYAEFGQYSWYTAFTEDFFNGMRSDKGIEGRGNQVEKIVIPRGCAAMLYSDGNKGTRLNPCQTMNPYCQTMTTSPAGTFMHFGFDDIDTEQMGNWEKASQTTPGINHCLPCYCPSLRHLHTDIYIRVAQHLDNLLSASIR